MSTEILIALIGIFSTIISGAVSWFFTRRKYNVEVRAGKISNKNSELDFYQRLADDNKLRLEQLLKENADLRELNSKLDSRCNRLEERINELNRDMFTVMSQICLNMQCSYRERKLPLFNKNIKNLNNEAKLSNDSQVSDYEDK